MGGGGYVQKSTRCGPVFRPGGKAITRTSLKYIAASRAAVGIDQRTTISAPWAIIGWSCFITDHSLPAFLRGTFSTERERRCAEVQIYCCNHVDPCGRGAVPDHRRALPMAWLPALLGLRWAERCRALGAPVPVYKPRHLPVGAVPMLQARPD